jgi:serine/threonine protein kinase/tetratricopeptide (TPR) repeat protein
VSVKCPKCQAKVSDDSRFCSHCGTPLPSQEKAGVTETMEVPREELTRGTTFADRYDIIEELGRGGMGRVYRVEDSKLKQEIALKLIKPEIAKDKKTIERFRNELKTARMISHKNVCRMFDIGEEKEAHFITMEYVPGEDLKSFIRRAAPLSIARAISIAKQVCEGLAEAHKLGVVHRDLKPQNVMIDTHGNARIMDFGIARSLEAKDITGAGVMIGTPEYMSPEQVEGKRVDLRSDIYSLGVILYEMVTGEVPFRGDTPFVVGVKHKTEQPSSPREVNDQVSMELDRLILKCLSKEKEKRYQSVEELLSRLTDIEQGISTVKSTIHRKRPETTGIPEMKWNFSTAVLPFADISPQKDQEYFCDGMTDDIITKLTKLPEVKVISRTSVMRYKNTDIDIREIGKELGVTTILEGSIQKSGDDIRVNAQLINVEDGFHLWAETYDRKLKNVFEIQSDLAENIVGALKAKLSPEEKHGFEKKPTEDIEAYNMYLKGRYFWHLRTAEGFQKSLEYFQKAIEKDPTFAQAYSGIADYFNLLGYYDLLPSREAFPKAREAAEKALEMDEKLAEAHTSLGWVKTLFEWDWPGAKKSFKRAIELNPGYATAHHWYAAFLTAVGRFDESIAEAKRAQELDPASLTLSCTLGAILWVARRYDDAIAELHRSIEFDPNSYIAHWYLVYPYALKGLYDEAVAEAKKALELSDRGPIMMVVLGQAYALSGKEGEARRVLSEMINLSKETYVSPQGIAIIYTGLGEKGKALEFLEKAYETRDHWMYNLKVIPYMDSLRSDPRFKALLRKMGLAE